jgi:hypothetical protein
MDRRMAKVHTGIHVKKFRQVPLLLGLAKERIHGTDGVVERRRLELALPERHDGGFQPRFQPFGLVVL